MVFEGSSTTSPKRPYSFETSDKQIMNFETPSKIVRLRVRIPENHFIDGPSEGQTVREQSPEIMPLQSVSSRPTPSARPLASSGSDANANAKVSYERSFCD
jgi:hypothetical protein